MTVRTNSEGKDVFRLSSENDNGFDVRLTDAEDATALKHMFSEILSSLLQDEEVSVSYEDTKDYKNGMYKEVCKEYVDVLATEIESAKARLITEGFIKIAPSNQMAQQQLQQDKQE